MNSTPTRAAILIQRSFRSYSTTLPTDNINKMLRYIAKHKAYIKQCERELDIIWKLYDEGAYPGYAIQKDTKRLNRCIERRKARLEEDQNRLVDMLV